MTPDQIAAIATLVKLAGFFSEWPFALLFIFLVIGPWVLSIFLAHAYQKRFESVVAMYENNVELVTAYNKLATDLHEVVMVNTRVMTELVQAIRTNQFCPMVRLQPSKHEV